MKKIQLAPSWIPSFGNYCLTSAASTTISGYVHSSLYFQVFDEIFINFKILKVLFSHFWQNWNPEILGVLSKCKEDSSSLAHPVQIFHTIMKLRALCSLSLCKLSARSKLDLSLHQLHFLLYFYWECHHYPIE